MRFFQYLSCALGPLTAVTAADVAHNESANPELGGHHGRHLAGRMDYPTALDPDDVTTVTITDGTTDFTGAPMSLTNPALTSIELGRPGYCYDAYIDIPDCAKPCLDDALRAFDCQGLPLYSCFCGNKDAVIKKVGRCVITRCGDRKAEKVAKTADKGCKSWYSCTAPMRTTTIRGFGTVKTKITFPPMAKAKVTSGPVAAANAVPSPAEAQATKAPGRI